ncbi:type II toxin-antitoxin system VapC family toxin [Candidatus Pacearchaeota archaeon]|nr:type II toxin-antitoxin system VapC family toxin [Candidatus Pacearchaeota archaeon]
MEIEMVFLDSSFIISYINKRDNNHNLALKIMAKILSGNYGRICLSDYVFSECATIFFKIFKDIKKTEIICRKLKEDMSFYIDKDIFEETFEIFIEQKNTKLSFVDCSIITLMRKNNINYLATFDKDFNEIDGIKVVS